MLREKGLVLIVSLSKGSSSMARISFGLVLTGKSRGEAQLLISSETPPRGAQLSSVSDPKLCWASPTQTIPFPCWINDTNNTKITNSQFHLEHLLLRGHQFPDVMANFQMLSPISRCYHHIPQLQSPGAQFMLPGAPSPVYCHLISAVPQVISLIQT